MTRMLSSKLAHIEAQQGYGLAFWCPGCDEDHVVWVGEGDRPRWGYNNNPELPTFTPSLLITSGHHVQGEEGKPCWCTFKERFGYEVKFKCRICHSFVTDGVIQFLPDCTHELAGQSVSIPDYPHKEQ